MIRKIQSANLNGKRVFIRCDFNVPIKEGRITDDFRIQNSLQTILYAINKGAKQVVLASHLGRPKGVDSKYSMQIIANRLKKYLGECYLHSDFHKETPNKKIILLENLRFNEGEKKGSLAFAKKLSKFADIYVNDAFGTSHRKHASMYALAKLMPSYAGFLIQKEIQNLKLGQKPSVAIFGALKFHDKISFLKKLLKEMDKVIIAGAAEFTFFKSVKIPIGKSFVDKESLEEAKKLLNKYSSKLIFPVDFTGKNSKGKFFKCEFDQIPSDVVCLDIGEKSVKLFNAVLKNAKSVLWNGPLGKFEEKPFDKGNIAVGKYLAKLNVETLICGGDTVNSLEKIKFGKKTFTSTGGGATLEYLSGKKLPAISILEKS